MPRDIGQITADELRSRIRAIKQDEEVAAQYLYVLDRRKREIEEIRKRLQGAIYTFERMLREQREVTHSMFEELQDKR